MTDDGPVLCSQAYTHAASLRQHQRFECGKEPQQQCPYCPHRTKLRGNLKKHIRERHMKLRRQRRHPPPDQPLPFPLLPPQPPQPPPLPPAATGHLHPRDFKLDFFPHYDSAQ